MNCFLCDVDINFQPGLMELLMPGPISQPVICQSCQQQFNSLKGNAVCSKCGRRLLQSSICEDCQKWAQKDQFSFHNTALYEYNAAFKEYMSRYKFMGDYRLRLIFKDELSGWLNKRKRQTNALVVPIPVALSTYQKRGFNQVTGMLDSGMATEVLKTISDVKLVRQSAKNRFERLQLAQPFAVKPQFENQLQQRTIILVDDVYTTGTTMRHAARLLSQNYGCQVESITLAR